MSCIAIIPARGGSKRIPRKNIKAFLGKPIIAYGIEAALNSGLFETVMVSTEDAEIAEVAQLLGAGYPFARSQENADDHATTVDVLLEVLEQYEQRGQSFEYGCCIYPTAPFVTAKKLTEAFELLQQQSYDCVFPVLRYGFPIQRGLFLDSERRIRMIQPEHIHTRSQDLEPAFHDSGQFYFFNVAALRKKKQLWTSHTGAITLSEMEAHDIDNEEDWAIAEFKYRINFHESS